MGGGNYLATNMAHEDDWKPLDAAAGNGHRAVVKLLQATDKYDTSAKKQDNQAVL